MTIAPLDARAFLVGLRFAPKLGGNAVILAVAAVYCCLPPSVQAISPPSSNAQSNILRSIPIDVTESKAIVRSLQTETTAGKPKDSTNAPAEAANVSKTGSTNRMDALDDRHKLNIGDRLSFQIIQDDDDPREISVMDSGEVEIPYLGRYPAVGETCKELAWKLKAALEKKYYYHATVIIAVDEWAKSQGKVYIVGPVHAPGPQEIPSDEVLTVSKAILRAGGFGDYADRHKVEVRRKSATPEGKDQVFTVDVGQILDKGKGDSDLPLEAGDLIYVPERLLRF
jgi:polysaccharide export outer membrane protein